MKAREIVVETGMAIRRPVKEVFEAVIDPAITAHFWFTRGNSKVEAGKRVRWEWDMYGVGIDVDIDFVDEDRLIVMRWPTGRGQGETVVTWTFVEVATDISFVTITNKGFEGDVYSVAAQAIDATEGFTLVLAGMKAFLEHGIELNLVADRHLRLASGDA